MKLKTARNRIRAYQSGALLLVLIVCVLIPGQLFAQTHALRVTLRDAGGVAITGITVVVRAESGEELTRQTTDADGGVSFGELPGVVLVAVEGQPRGGPRLYQLGADAQGVRVVLDASDTPLTLNLRAERDGLVLPDPATMLTLEEGGPIVVETTPIPTAAVATPAPLPTARRTAITPSGSGRPAGEPPPQAGWVAPVTLLVVVVATVLLRLVSKLRSTR